ncbi:hypothetical protein [Salana multivorans]
MGLLDDLALPRGAVVVRADHATGLDEVGPGIAHLDHDRPAQHRAQDHAGRDRREAGSGGDDDVRPVFVVEVGEPAADGVGTRDRLVEAAREQARAVLAEMDPDDRLAPLALADGAGPFVRGERSLDVTGRVVRGRGQHRDAVTRGDEAADERAPTALRRAHLWCVVVREQRDVHRLGVHVLGLALTDPCVVRCARWGDLPSICPWHAAFGELGQQLTRCARRWQAVGPPGGYRPDRCYP